MIRELARVVPAPPGKPVREEAARGQERARRLVLRPGTWDRQEAAAMRAGFDAAACGCAAAVVIGDGPWLGRGSQPGARSPP